jgi:hypothetical protein
VAPVPPLPRPTRAVAQRRWAIGASIVLAAMLASAGFVSRGEEQAMTRGGSAALGGAVGFHPHGRQRPAPPASAFPLSALITTSRECWVMAVADGTIVLHETVPANETVRLRATRRLELRLGDAGAARLLVNGRPIATGGRGDVADISFAWRGGSLIRVQG